MLVLRFGLENYKCFRDYTEVSFISSAQQDEPSFRFAPAGFGHKLLPVLGVFGANASGKSNLLKGLVRFTEILRRSFVLQPSELIPREPWEPYRRERARLTRFDVDVLIEGVRYHYGFAYHEESFQEEWLYQWPGNRKQVLFERHEEDKDKWYFGPSMTGAKTMLSNATRANSLFLATAAQYNHPQMSAIFHHLTQNIRSAGHLPSDLYGAQMFFSRTDPILLQKEKSEKILKKFDIGFKELQFKIIKEEPFSHHIQKTTNNIQNITEAEHTFRPVLVRQNVKSSWTLDFSQESHGTQVLIYRLNDLLGMQQGLLIIDELSAHLHEEITHKIINTFTSEKNKKSIQLLFCDHDRSLMQRLRRDEILLVSKGEDGASSLASMADYKDLRARDDRQKVYELGQVGAVPILGELDGLLEE